MELYLDAPYIIQYLRIIDYNHCTHWQQKWHWRETGLSRHACRHQQLEFKGMEWDACL